MGVFNGNSIYNEGAAGGGALKNGGYLNDDSFIEFSNNTYSFYDNINDKISLNFLVEKGKDEILDSYLEITSSVSASINIYELIDGIVYKIGYADSNSISSGISKISIIGDSFSIDSINNKPEVEYVGIKNNLYGIIKVNNLLWLTSNYKDDDFVHAIDGDTYYFEHESIKNANIDGWRLPTRNEFISLTESFGYNELKSTSGWKDGYNGDNASKFNAYPLGMYKKLYNDFANKTEFAQFQGNISKLDLGNTSFSIGYNDTQWNIGTGVDDFWEPVRLVKEV